MGLLSGSLTFDHDDGTRTDVTVEIDKETYLTLVQRYKELFNKSPVDPDPPYDVDPHITEINTDIIDSDYMNSRFKQFIRDLNKGDATAKQRNLDELHKSFASLSQEDQSFARQFLNDVENGLPVEENKNLSDYIAEYKSKSYNDKIFEIAIGMGLDNEKLRSLINLHPVESDLLGYLNSSYIELLINMDLSKARSYLETKLGRPLPKDRQVKMEADEFLRKVLLYGV